MTEEVEKPEWERLLAGGFCFMTAPFASHKLDRDRAAESVRLAKREGISADEYVDAARRYLETAHGWPTDINVQLAAVRKFIKNKLF